MLYPIHEYIQKVAREMAEGDVVVKYRAQPKVKPPRRNTGVRNKSNRDDYSQCYMKEYREDGKDYQPMPKPIKELRKKQRQDAKKKKEATEVMRIDSSPHVGIGVNYPTAMLNITSNDNNLLIIS